MRIKKSLIYLCICTLFYAPAFSSFALDSSSTEAGALCIDGAFCGGGGSSFSSLAESVFDQCPKFIIEQQALRDSKGSLTADSPDEVCLKGAAAFEGRFKSAGEFESYLRQSPFFSDLNTPSHFSSCLSQGVSVSIGLGKTYLAQGVRTVPEDKKKLAVAEHYSSLRRLSDGAARSLQNITAIDLMIGENTLLEGVSCSSYGTLSRSVKDQCRSVQQCSSSNTQNSRSLQESAKDTLLALKAVEAVEEEITRIRGVRNTGRADWPKRREKIQELRERQQRIQSLYPWVIGKKFKQAYKTKDYAGYGESSEESKRGMEVQMAGLIKDQLSYTREKLKERSEEFIRASDCIKGGGESLCVELDMDKVLAKAPPVNHEEVFGRERKKELKRKMEEGGLSSEERGEYRRLLTQESEADGLFERAECLQTQRRAVSGVNRELALGALDVGIVIGTMGLGAPYAAGRIALKLGGALTKAQRMSKAKRLQNAGIFGADASLSAPYMQEAAEACEDRLNQLEETAALGEERGSDNKVCKSLPLRVKHTSDLKGCILKASLASLPITLPLLGLSGIAAARGVKGAKASSMPSSSASKRAEEVLKTKLSPAQRRAVEEAHLAGQGERGKNGALAGIGNYTRDQLRRKAEILDRAGFSRNQRRELIEAGAAGDDILRTAGRELEEGLQEIRMTPQELHFQRAGFKEEYYRGLDQAREFNKVKEWLQKIKADPKRTHIPYFADQVEKTIADFERDFKLENKWSIFFLRKRLKLLEAFKREAGQRIKDQNVTYDWWSSFNLRLAFLSTPNASLRLFMDADINDIVSHENMEKFLAKGKESIIFPNDNLSKFLRVKEEFPDEIIFFTTEELGIMAFNRMGNQSYLIQLSGKSKTADNNTLKPAGLFGHDLSHAVEISRTANLSRYSSSIPEIDREIVSRLNNIPNTSDQEKAELALFLFQHEAEGRGKYLEVLSKENNRDRGEVLRTVMREFLSKEFNRGSKETRLRSLLPSSVEENQLESFVDETVDVFMENFSDILI